MTIDGALSGATDGFARALADGRIEDMPEDMAKGAFGGAIGGLAIGGSTRLIFSGASKINNKLFGSLTESALDINSAKLQPLQQNHWPKSTLQNPLIQVQPF